MVIVYLKGGQTARVPNATKAYQEPSDMRSNLINYPTLVCKDDNDTLLAQFEYNEVVGWALESD